MSNFYSILEYVANAGQSQFPVVFEAGYIKKADVSLTVDGVSTPFTWLSDGLISIAPLAGGERVVIQRNTDIDQLSHVYTDGATLTEDNLDDSFKQSLLAAQEANDIVQASMTVDIITGKWDADDRIISNVNDGVDDNDAVNVQQLRVHDAEIIGYKDDAETFAIASQNSATASSNSATASANSATASANSATQSSNSATASANSASAAATSASNASTSETNVNNRLDTVQTNGDTVEENLETITSEPVATQLANAASNASSALTSANNAANSATASANSATASANSASQASTSASNAANSATASANSATASANSATQSANSATASANSATASANSASAAATSESNAATSEGNASNSATAAANSASAASTSETNAGNSATAAANSASAAEGFKDDAETAAASVDAQNIVHAPGTGLPNEAGTAYTLNQGDVVQTTGDQTILGQKTFEGNIDFEEDIFPRRALAFTSNTDTPDFSNFIHRPAARTLAFGTDRLERMRITDTGQLKTKVTGSSNAVMDIYGCRAWVNFDGTTTPPNIRASGNVSSVTRNSTGDYTVNFIVSMPDSNYCTNFTSNQAQDFIWGSIVGGTDPTASAVRVRARTDSSNPFNIREANVLVFK